MALITPILLASSAYGAYFFFGGLTLVGVVILLVYMPETRGRSLESIQDEFRRPTLSYMSGLVRLLRSRHRVGPSPQLVNEGIELSRQ